MDHLLSLMTFIPLLGMFVVLALPRDNAKLIKITALAFTIPSFLLGVWLYQNFDRSLVTMQFVERFQWIPSFNIQYIMGVDGLSVTMLLLTALLCPICVLAAWEIDKGVKGFFALFLLLETGMMGVFAALDFFLFFIFWEVMLLPMYFLIGVWGGPRREYAAIKFFLYTLVGSVLMLVAMLALYFTNDPHTFDLMVLMDKAPTYTRAFQSWAWIALFIGFAIKIPAFPFHTWLPDAHVEAPTAISVILAGVLLKMGTYGILRICFPIFPLATQDYAFWALAALGTWNIVYGALCAMAQEDMKKLVAYSSISHMGYVMLGMATLTPQGINGAVLQMFNHGTVTAMLFLIVGVIYDRAHHRRIDGFGGLASVMPVYTGIMTIAFFAALGLPGLSAFISEVLVLLGAWQYNQAITVIAASAVVLTAAYMLWMLQRVWLGPVNEKYADLPDVDMREKIMLVPLAIIVMILGVYPHAVLDLMNPTLVALNGIVRDATPAVAALQ
ncbi:MAG TPA: NADH-quinone oxidoreductase subunit M [Candidatus Binatia bacterium]|nr:NADH-quinone oxidoreductase subunit M [Candidatus Binatia bacterium]